MAKRQILACILVLLAGLIALPAQNQNGTNPFLMSIRASGCVPHPIATNKAFKRSFTGVYDITAAYDVQVFHGVQVGLAYHHSLWKTPDNKIPSLNTYCQTHHGGLRVGYDHVLSETTVAYFGLSALTGQAHFYGISYTPDTAHVPLVTRFRYKTMEADAGVYFYTEGNFALGIHIAAVFTNFNFDPYALYLDQHKAYVASDLEGNVANINFGFDLVFSFLKRKG